MTSIERNKRYALAGNLARYERMSRGADGGGGGDAENLNMNEDDQSSTIKNSKKAEAK